MIDIYVLAQMSANKLFFNEYDKKILNSCLQILNNELFMSQDYEYYNKLIKEVINLKTQYYANYYKDRAVLLALYCKETIDNKCNDDLTPFIIQKAVKEAMKEIERNRKTT